MSAAPLAAPRPRGLGVPRVVAWGAGVLGTDALAVSVIALWAAMLSAAMPKLLVQDSWLSFVGGRLVAQHGLPHADTLTVWAQGRPWLDQQWGAHLALYELIQLGGLRLAIVVAVACVLAAIAAACVVTRRLGATPVAAAAGAVLPVLGAPWMTQVRAQSLALPLFVAVYGLLALDSRRPGRRVLLVLPILLVWANLHGSVVLAAGLTALHGVTLARHHAHRARALALAVGAPLCVLATPYGFAVVGYYRLMLLSSPLKHYVREWQAPGIQGITAGLFVSAFVVVALWARNPRAVTGFERWAIPLLLVGAMTALRNAIWFELAAAVTLPRLLDAARRTRPATPGVRRVNVVVGSLAVTGALLIVATELARPAAWLQRDLPPSAAASIAKAAGPSGIVLSDDVHSDWLLWQQPSLAGRVAYDVRFELFDKQELLTLKGLQDASVPSWRACGGVARVVTFATPARRLDAVRQGVLDTHSRVLVDLPSIAAVAQTPSHGHCSL